MVRLCRFNDEGTCTECGVPKSAGELRNCPAKPWKYRSVPQKIVVPKLAPKKPPQQKMGLGDYTERLLKSVGVTPERYSQAKAKFGMAPTCNCASRKEWLNKVGRWVTGG